MSSHCAGTVYRIQMREKSESGIRKWEEMWHVKSHLFSLSYPAFWLFSHLYFVQCPHSDFWQQKTERERGKQWLAMEDCSTDERLQQETLCRRHRRVRRTSRDDTLMKQNGVVVSFVWHDCLLVDVVRHTGRPTLAPDRFDICTPTQRLSSTDR